MLKAFYLPSFMSASFFGGSTANEKHHYLCALCASSEAGGESSLHYMLIKAWTTNIAEGLGYKLKESKWRSKLTEYRNHNI
jgi:hypothetical protein